MPRLYICLFLQILTLCSLAQNGLRPISELQTALSKSSSPDTNRAKILYDLAVRYITKDFESKKELDSGYYCLTTAMKLYDSLQYRRYIDRMRIWLGVYYFEYNDTAKAVAHFDKIIVELRQKDNQRVLATALNTFAMHYPKWNTADPRLFALFRETRDIYHALKDSSLEGRALSRLADLYIRKGLLDSGEIYLLQAIHLQELSKYAGINNTYSFLSDLYVKRGNTNQALRYALQAVKSLPTQNDTPAVKNSYARIGQIYMQLGNYEKCIEWNNKVMAIDLAGHPEEPSPFYYRSAARNVDAIIKLGKRQQALTYLNAIVKDHPPSARYTGRFYAQLAFGNAYTALGRFDAARPHFESAIALLDSYFITQDERVEAWFRVGQFYTITGNAAKAGFYLKKVLSLPKTAYEFARTGDIELLLFKIDSARGDLLSAIGHYQAFKAITDSLQAENVNNQLSEYQVKYETKQKEDNIRILRQDSKLQMAELQKSNGQKRLILGGALLLLAILALLYNSYRLKRRSNKQQQEIIRLQQKLLQEKEWLLRETHHRVKNNLQIVMSLLNTQSRYLDDESAISATQESLHRMQAMSLIHKKLYQSENIEVIDMQKYIGELVAYLKDSFNSKSNIHYMVEVANIELDVVQAVPVGLILNEAITNAIKYAFTGKVNNTIHIGMEQSGQDISLRVRDNGIGLPVHPPGQVPGFGMNLMRTLGEQLEGSFDMESSSKGVSITVVFPEQKETNSRRLISAYPMS